MSASMPHHAPSGGPLSGGPLPGGSLSGAPTPFDLCGPLPRGDVVLEASAGTGKTYTIAGLVTRWVAETELRLPRMLVVTFTRAATAELRDRVRARLVHAFEAVEATSGGGTVDRDDPVLQAVTDCDPAELQRRQRRLARAMSDVDVATISTIHGFCQHVLEGLGIAGDLDRDAELVEDLHDLVEEVVDDLLVSTYLQPGDLPRVSRGDLVRLGRAVVGNPMTAFAPHAPDDPVAALRLRFAAHLRAEVTQRARRRRRLSYDDLLVRLESTLSHPERGEAARRALRDRYHVTLIDEFQDTDPVQWRIVSSAFAQDSPPAGEGTGDGRALVLIGDPKQAIYAFRGADVYAYLAAARQSRRRHTLATSWRADGGLLQAFDALFGGATFGHPDIPYRQVTTAPGRHEPGLLGAHDPAALRLRLLPRHPSLARSGRKIKSGAARDIIARDVAADIVELLGARPAVRATEGQAERPLLPGDIAVLVRSHTQAADVQQRLHERHVPAVVGSSQSVFGAPAAQDWSRLLEALERPASTTKVRALALSAWVGWTGEQVAAAGEDDWARLHGQVHDWARLLRERGVAAMFRAVGLARSVARRLLSLQGGERLLADLEHIAELAHAAAAAEHLGATGLSAWLHQRMDEAGEESNDDRLRRLETDDDAVQVLTVHRSKGLEFPVVYCPYLWTSNTEAKGLPVFHDDDGRRHLDVGGGDHPDHAAHCARAEDEARGEELRLAYVALTRARHQAVVWLAPAGNCEWSGLTRMVLCRDDDATVDTQRKAPTPDDDGYRAAVAELAERASGHIAVETVPEAPSDAPWVTEVAPAAPLDRARFRRALDTAWRRTSYSALTRIDDPTPQVGTEPRDAVKDDEADVGAAGTADGAAGTAATTAGAGPDEEVLRSTDLPLSSMPGGTRIGTFVHHVLEHTDFAADDLEEELRRVVSDGMDPAQLGLDPDVLVDGLRAALMTPLGPTADGVALRSVTRADRRDEVEFELPLDRIGTATDGGRPATVADVAALMVEHLPADDPLAAYPAHLPDAVQQRTLRGFLGGSIDLVMRRATADGPVFHIVDYKTNRLGLPGIQLTAWDYRPAALADAMMHGHYPVQALLYAVAVHRLLRWRLADYDPGRHIGSTLYLFLRGMAGPDTPAPGGQPCGVFAWTPPASLVTATSDLLHGVAAA